MRHLWSVGLTALAAALPAPAQTVDEVLARHLEARGGQAAVDAFTSLRARGRAVFGGGAEAPFTYEWKRPDRFRFELTLGGTTEIDACDGETCWIVEPPEQPQPGPMPPQQRMMLNDAVDILGPLVGPQAKGHTVALLGREEVEGTPAFKLAVTKKNGFAEVSYLDAEHFLEILQVETYSMPGGGELKMVVTWGDYKEVGGVLVPHYWERHPEGAPRGMTLMFEHMEANPDIPDGRFAMPAGE